MLIQGNLQISPLEEQDMKTLAAWETQEFRGEFEEYQMASPENLRRQLNQDGLCSESFQMLMIRLDELPVGLLYLNFVRMGLVRLGLVLDPGARGQHLGSRVLELTRDYLLDNYPVVRIEADTDVENFAAQKALERCGFSAEGVLRKYRFHHGRYHDSYLYSYFRDEKF